MKTGARNNLTGKITSIKKGDIMCQVKFDVTPGSMQSVMTVDSLKELGVEEGDEVRVVVKAINVLLVKE